MYIELFGYPASGKTRLMNDLKKSRPEIKIRKNPGSIEVVSNIITNFGYFTRLSVFLIKNKVFSLDFLLVMTSIKAMYNYRKNEIYLTDHGFLQTLPSNKQLVNAIRKNKKLRESYLTFLPSGIYVYLDEDRNICVSREKTRSKLSKQKMQDACDLIKIIIKTLKNSTLKIHKIKNAKELDILI